MKFFFCWIGGTLSFQTPMIICLKKEIKLFFGLHYGNLKKNIKKLGFFFFDILQIKYVQIKKWVEGVSNGNFFSKKWENVNF